MKYQYFIQKMLINYRGFFDNCTSTFIKKDPCSDESVSLCGQLPESRKFTDRRRHLEKDSALSDWALSPV